METKFLNHTGRFDCVSGKIKCVLAEVVAMAVLVALDGWCSPGDTRKGPGASRWQKRSCGVACISGEIL